MPRIVAHYCIRRVIADIIQKIQQTLRIFRRLNQLFDLFRSILGLLGKSGLIEILFLVFFKVNQIICKTGGKGFAFFLNRQIPCILDFLLTVVSLLLFHSSQPFILQKVRIAV